MNNASKHRLCDVFMARGSIGMKYAGAGQISETPREPRQNKGGEHTLSMIFCMFSTLERPNREIHSASFAIEP